MYTPIQIDCFNKKGDIIKTPKNYETPNKIRFVLPFQVVLEWDRDEKELNPLTVKDFVLLKKLVTFIKSVL